jgi:Ca2+-binding EF-hand superfamily protein
MLRQFDADGDGRLTQAEIDTARTERFAKYDGNGDGALSLEEFSGLFQEVSRPMMVRAYQKLDPNGDASVTADEFDRPFSNLVERHDRDGDGALSPSDMKRGHHRRHYEHGDDDDS